MPVVRFVAAFLLAVWPALAAPVPKDFKKNLPVYFPLNPGDEWVYELPGGTTARVITRDVAEKDGTKTGTLVTLVGEKEVATETVRVDRAGVHRTNIAEHAIEPPVTMISFDPERENKWTVKAKVQGQEIAGSYEVAGKEGVEVPAGKYAAVKVVADLTVAGQPAKFQFWFAEGVGQVKVVFEIAGTKQEMTLKEYHPATREKK